MSLARLSTTDAALQSLALEPQAVTWTRTGTAPEVQQVTFDLSADGTNFTTLGTPLWVTNGWRLGGLSLPVGQNFFIRARGRSISGRYSGSSGLIESVAQFWQLPPPFLNNVQVLGGGQFQFSFTNTNATAFSVLASTNAAAPSRSENRPALWCPWAAACINSPIPARRITRAASTSFAHRRRGANA